MSFLLLLRIVRHRVTTLGCIAIVAACSGTGRVRKSVSRAINRRRRNQLFTRLPSSAPAFASRTGSPRRPSCNVFTYRNFYNGGGVAIGDLTGDGLPEVVLTSNQDGPQLYLNKGKFRFRDITDASGVTTQKGSWTTGVAVADVNGDGLLDIYICKAGPGRARGARANELWINQGVGQGRRADASRRWRRQYGVADEGYSTQARFFDYDRDGDLDLFVHQQLAAAGRAASGCATSRNVRGKYGGAKLYRNDRRRATSPT